MLACVSLGYTGECNSDLSYRIQINVLRISNKVFEVSIHSSRRPLRFLNKIFSCIKGNMGFVRNQGLIRLLEKILIEIDMGRATSAIALKLFRNIEMLIRYLAHQK